MPDSSGAGSVPFDENSTNTPVDGINETTGGVTYPVPCVTSDTDVTDPFEIWAVAVAPVPPPPSIFTIGGFSYPDPPSPAGIVMFETKDVSMAAIACAWFVLLFCNAIPL